MKLEGETAIEKRIDLLSVRFWAITNIYGDGENLLYIAMSFTKMSIYKSCPIFLHF